MSRSNPLFGARLLAPFLRLAGRAPASSDTPPEGAAEGTTNPPEPGAITPPAPAPEAADKKKKKGDDSEYQEGDEDEEDERDREEMRGAAGHVAQHARIRERSRIAAIMGHPAAAANLGLARQLAFGTTMGRSEACGVLAASAPQEDAQGGELSAAMAGFAGIRPGAGAPPAPTGAKALEAGWDRVMERSGLMSAKR